MADRAEEVTLPGGVLRVEVSGSELDKVGVITATLNGQEISKDKARELLARALLRAGA